LEESQQRRLKDFKPDQKCFFDLYLDLQSRRDSLQDLTQVFDGAFNLMTAGIHTTSYTLSWATFLILASPSVLAKIKAELLPFNKENFDTDKIQNLPYLVCFST
jgi:cytochrome P450